MATEFESIINSSADPIMSRLISFGRLIVPQRFRAGIRDVLLGPPNIPFDKPYRLKSRMEAMFYIQNRSDYHRIVKGGVEEGYRLEMEKIFTDEGEIGRFLDIGCAQGLYSILAAKYGLFVDAIDPDPISLVSLKANTKLNSLVDRVRVHPIALADREGKADLYIDRDGSLAPSMVQTVDGLKNKIEVPVFTVDGLIKRGELFSPTMVKIDVEGAEGRVLEGMKELLSSSNKPQHIFIELHKDYLPRFGDNICGVGKYVLNYGYKVSWSVKCPSGLLCYFAAN